MPSFVCDTCQETLKKARLDDHFRRCPRASFSCIDCYKSFGNDGEYKAHTSCITEVQKYEKKGVTNISAPKKKHVEKETDLTSKKRRNTIDDAATPDEAEERTNKERRDRKVGKKHRSSKHKHHEATDGQRRVAPSNTSKDQQK